MVRKDRSTISLADTQKRPVRARRTFTAEQKAEILRRYIKGKEAVSDLCEEYGLQPSTFYSTSAL